MKRVDWQLIRPPKPRAKGVAAVVRKIDALVGMATESVLGEDALEELVALEERHEALTVAPCEAVSAPRVDDDPDWETRTIDEYAEGDLDMELEDYLELRRGEPDCERCPYAQPYSVFPMDPCEFSAGALLEIVPDRALLSMAMAPMAAAEMRAVADGLEALVEAQAYRQSAAVDALDYLKKAIFFLRFWSKLDFGVRPLSLDDMDAVLTPDGPIGDVGPSDEPPPFLH